MPKTFSAGEAWWFLHPSDARPVRERKQGRMLVQRVSPALTLGDRIRLRAGGAEWTVVAVWKRVGADWTERQYVELENEAGQRRMLPVDDVEGNGTYHKNCSCPTEGVTSPRTPPAKE